MSRRRSAAARFILENSLLLLAGTVAAVAWANIDHDSYDHVAHRRFLGEGRGYGLLWAAKKGISAPGRR